MSHVCHRLVTSRLDTQVIPVTQENGLIEWVANTVPIKAVLEDEWTAMLPPGAAMRIKLGPAGNTKALQYRQKYLRMCLPDQRDLALQHHACATQFLPSDVVHMFRQTLKMVPRDLLRRRLLSMSNGADAFMTVRSEVRVFARLVWLRGVQCTHSPSRGGCGAVAPVCPGIGRVQHRCICARYWRSPLGQLAAGHGEE